MSQHPLRPGKSGDARFAPAPLNAASLDHATLIACIAAQHPSLRTGWAMPLHREDILAPDSLDARIALFAGVAGASSALGAFDCDTASLRHDRATGNHVINLCASGDGKQLGVSDDAAPEPLDAARVSSLRTL